MARPTKYNGQETIDETLAYIEECENKYESYVIVDEEGVPLKDTDSNKALVHHNLLACIPTAAGLGLRLGVGKSTIYDWAKEHEEFSDTLGLLQSKQEKMLVENGLSGLYNSNIAKLMLHNHGYSDKKDVDHSGGITLTQLHSKAKEE